MVESQRPDPSIEGVLSQLGHAANLGISPEEFLTRAIDGLLQVAQAPAGVACLVNPEGNKLEVVSIRRIGAAVARTLPHAFHLDVERGSGQFARPIRIGQEEFPGLGELHARLRAEGMTGGILLPLSSDGRLLGLLIAMYRAGAEPAPTPAGAPSGPARSRSGAPTTGPATFPSFTPTRRTGASPGRESAWASAPGSSGGRPSARSPGSPRTCPRSCRPPPLSGIESLAVRRA